MEALGGARPWARPCWPPPASTSSRILALHGAGQRSRPSPTSPAAASMRTSPAASPTAWPPRSTSPATCPVLPIFDLIARRPATCSQPGDVQHLQHGRRHDRRGCSQDEADKALAALQAAGRAARPSSARSSNPPMRVAIILRTAMKDARIAVLSLRRRHQLAGAAGRPAEPARSPHGEIVLVVASNEAGAYALHPRGAAQGMPAAVSRPEGPGAPAGL